MIRKSIIPVFIVSLLMFVLAGCPEITDPSFSYDPDPVEDPSALPTPAEDLYIIASVDGIGGEVTGKGSIIGFRVSNALDYKVFTNEAAIEDSFSSIRISPDLKYILYAKINGAQRDLTLLNVVTMEEVCIAPGIASNESEFIDNNTLQYSNGGRIRSYTISTGVETILVTSSALNCNHGGQVSPDGNRLIFKDQDPSQNEYATIALADTIPTDSCNSVLSYSGEIELVEPFYFCWRDNGKAIFKPNPGLAYRLNEKTVGVNMLPPAVLSANGENVYFEKLAISPDKKNLLIYGYNGLYILDLLANADITGTVEPEEIYYSPQFITKYTSFGSESKSFVVGTLKWMGIYNTEGLQKTNASISDIFGDYGTLYALHCR